MKKLIALSLVSLFLFGCEKENLIPSFKPSRDKLIAEYLFNNNYLDSSENKYNLTTNNYGTGVNPGAFNVDGSFNFAGKNGLVSDWIYNWTDEVSASFWINPSLTMNSTSGWRSDFISHSWDARTPFQIFYSGKSDVPPNTPKGSIVITLWNDGGITYQIFSFPIILDQGKWYHIAMTAKGKGNVILYINGNSYDLGAVKENILPSSSRWKGQLNIGFDRSIVSRNYNMFGFSGKMDDVRIYGRILSSKEIEYFGYNRR
jgi:hypothetical protein